MDCNKEEAIRAKEIAEKKMQSCDFLGARKVALKAQQLFPELENISQLLTVCEVHCSAHNKIHGSEMDWYSILQINTLADEATIKKQYRKLALLLHPDKNKFAGAEAAFKLVGEANRVLSDKGKRSLHDMKCRVSVRTAAPKPPPHQVNSNSFVRKQYAGQNSVPGVANPFIPGLNPHYQTHSGMPTFWTCCDSCNVKYQYYINVMNKALRCQGCNSLFLARDLGPQGVPPGSNWSQPVFNHQKGVPAPGAFQARTQSTGGIPPSGMGFQQSFTTSTAGAKPVPKAKRDAEVVGRSKTKGKEHGHVGVGGGKDGTGLPKSNATKIRESGSSNNKSRKRGRKLVVESSASSDSESSDDAEEDVIIQDNTRENAGLNGGRPRRSSRQKQQVSYDERIIDDDFVSPPKRSRVSGLSSTDEEVKEAARDSGVSKIGNPADMNGGKEELKQKVSSSLEEGLLKRKRKAGKDGKNGTEGALPDQTDEEVEADDSESNGTPEILEYPDPDFSDFEKDKTEDSFAVDQIWAIYDAVDGMPRFYARIKKIFSPGFKLRITWFEPHSDDQGQIEWVKKNLPVACGRFTHGDSLVTTDRLMFSHQVHCEKGSIRGSCMIYPRKGETWALFKNWDLRWSSDLENYKPFKFEFVEVLSDFVQNEGIEVAHLGKVRGFVSIFQQTVQNGILSFRIPPSELLRFSHRIPSFRMTGTEREGVPKGSFELDPVSLPNDLDEFCDLSDVKMQSGSTDAEVNPVESSENNVKPAVGSERINTPRRQGKIDLEIETSRLGKSPGESNSTLKKHSRPYKDIFGIKEGDNFSCQPDGSINTPKKHKNTDPERDLSNLRRSPRELNCKKAGPGNSSQRMTQNEYINHIDGSKEENPDCLIQSKGSDSSCQADKEMWLNGNGRSSKSSTRNSSPHPSIPGHRIPEPNGHNFNEEKSEEKFQLGQVWALYSETNKLPKIYAQVKKVESTPDFRVHVALLEACSGPKETIPPVCWTFKLKIGKHLVFPTAAFSHHVKAEPAGKNRFEIYPREGEVWAIYKNWSTELTSSDLENCECDIVEVLEGNDKRTRVSPLVRVNGLKAVYKAPKRRKSNTGIMEISRADFARFSHQIPAFWHTGEKNTHLKDCWELDQSSIPGIVICLD